jgi:hypothetical protein
MIWKYIIGSPIARHLESGIDFNIEYRSKNIQGINDIEISPATRTNKQWTSEELTRFKESLWLHCKDDERRMELRSLIDKEFLGENNRAASAISSVTGKSVSERTIQAWLIELDKPSSRKCPAWALKALKDYLANPENQRNLEEASKFRSEYPIPKTRFDDVFDRDAVNLATKQIEADQKALNDWKSANFESLPNKLYELEKNNDRQFERLENTVSIFINALRQSETLDDLKNTVLKELREADAINNTIRTTRRAIENGLEEFSNQEGMMIDRLNEQSHQGS